MAMRRSMQLACIFLLLFAQQAAFTHALWHAQRQLPSAHVELSTVYVSQQPRTADVALLCAFDVAVSQVLGGVLSGSDAALHTPAMAETPHRLARSAPFSHFPAPLSRGPPSPLPA
jgi:hypothetical protein